MNILVTGTFRDMDTRNLQSEIKKLITSMHWSQAKAARCIHSEISESDNEEEILRYVEAFKKKLKRPTTPPEHLREIFEILSRERTAQKLGQIKPTYVPGLSLDPATRKAMLEISRAFDRDLENDELRNAEELES